MDLFYLALIGLLFVGAWLLVTLLGSLEGGAR